MTFTRFVIQTLKINIIPIHKAILKSVPHISAVCTVDETMGELIIKLVNIIENDIAVELVSDMPMPDHAFITTLTAESMQAGNSFALPEAVVISFNKTNAPNRN